MRILVLAGLLACSSAMFWPTASKAQGTEDCQGWLGSTVKAPDGRIGLLTDCHSIYFQDGTTAKVDTYDTDITDHNPPAATVLNETCSGPEHWPEPRRNPAWAATVEKLHKEFMDKHLTIAPESEKFVPLETFLGWKRTKNVKAGSNIKMVDGIPALKMGKYWRYNPTTIAQYGIAEGMRGDKAALIRTADKLIQMSDARGALIVQYPVQHYTQKKWIPFTTSAMAQGQALTVWARAYHETKDEKYRQAGEKAIDYMLTPTKDAGTTSSMADLDPSLCKYVWYQEWVVEPQVFTLNGFGFTLLGLYEWAEVMGSERAKAAFDAGISSLDHSLPLFDFGGWSAYDLSFMTYDREVPHAAADYHMVHIELLNALYSVTGDPVLKQWADKWKSYIE